MDKLDFVIKGTPFAKQSTRFNKHGHTYTPQKVKNAEENIGWQVENQLPAGFEKWECPIRVDYIIYVFPILKSMRVATKKAIKEGLEIYKCKAPDLTDNLAKGLFDALEGIIYNNDSRIVEVNHIKKIFGVEPQTKVGLSKVNQKVI